MDAWVHDARTHGRSVRPSSAAVSSSEVDFYHGEFEISSVNKIVYDFSIFFVISKQNVILVVRSWANQSDECNYQ